MSDEPPTRTQSRATMIERVSTALRALTATWKEEARIIKQASHDAVEKEKPLRLRLEELDGLQPDLSELRDARARLEWQYVHASTDGKSPPDSPAFERQRRLEPLRREAEVLGRKLVEVDTELASADKELAKARQASESCQRSSARWRRTLEKRNMLTRVVKYIFGDLEKKEAEQASKDADEAFSRVKKVRAEHDKLVAHKDDLIEKLRLAREKIVSIEAEQKEAIQLVSQQIEQIDARMAAVRREHKRQTEAERASLEAQIDQIIDEEEKIANEAEEAGKRKRQPLFETLQKFQDRIVRRQPPLVTLSAENVVLSEKSPDALAFGTSPICIDCGLDFFPQLVPFPLPKALWTAASADSAEGLVHALLLRLMTALPAGLLDVMVCDPRGLGHSLGHFKYLLEKAGPLAGWNVLVRDDEIEHGLQRQTDILKELVQLRFRGDISNWERHLRAHPDRPLPYRVILYFDAPEQMNERSRHALSRLIERGPAGGILPVFTFTPTVADNKPFAAFRAAAEPFWQPLEEICGAAATADPVPPAARPVPETLPPAERWPGILAVVSEGYRRAAERPRDLSELWIASPLWSERSSPGLRVPLGFGSDGAFAEMELGQIASTAHHALLAGKTGSGKSNLLHVLIHSLCHRYSPAELRLFLLDYKQGAEMNSYARARLPHAELVATESDTEYGVMVLRHLCGEMERRSNLCKAAAVADLPAYVEKTGRPLPRLLVVVDEFQVLFSESAQVAQEAEQLLDKLLRQGRSWGVHVLLATQSVRGIQNLSPSTIGRLTVRICLSCSQEDSALVLSPNNVAGAELRSPPQAILNADNGSKSANRLFDVAHAKPESCEEHLAHLRTEAEKLGLRAANRVFDGARLPALPDLAFFTATLAAAAQAPALLLGESLDFEAHPFVLPLPKRPGANVLCVGPSAAIRRGLTRAIVRSVAAQEAARLFVFNARDDSAWRAGDRIEVLPSDWSGILSELPTFGTGELAILLIDGLDSARVFHCEGRAIKIPPAVEALLNWLENGPSSGWRTVAIADNWRRLEANSHHQLLPRFQFRLGHGLSENDAGKFLTDAPLGRTRGLEKSSRALFADLHANDTRWFRPYAPHTDADAF